MEWIAEQSYYKVVRIMTGLEQQTVKQQRLMHLYPERIQTKYRSFPLHEVHDLSFRTLSGGGGILYVHTNHGVYSYTVSQDPHVFLQAFFEQKKQES